MYTIQCVGTYLPTNLPIIGTYYIDIPAKQILFSKANKIHVNIFLNVFSIFGLFIPILNFKVICQKC